MKGTEKQITIAQKAINKMIDAANELKADPKAAAYIDMIDSHINFVKNQEFASTIINSGACGLGSVEGCIDVPTNRVEWIQAIRKIKANM